MLYDTKVLNHSDKNIEYVAKLLQDGEIVGIPTETVYGLGADATNIEAVKKIFLAKGRPQDNPLIVHLSSIDEIMDYVEYVPDIAYKLAEKFCPGPLTMVLKKKDIIPDITSAGLDTVGIRIPYHHLARRIIKACGKPIAAPSANLSGSPSPTTAMHVYDDMNGKIPAIIDGGSCSVGVESTVICFNNDYVRILRPGFISEEKIKEVTNKVIIDKAVLNKMVEGDIIISPGMKYKHYSPKANVIIIEGNMDKFTNYVNVHSEGATYGLIFDEDKLEGVPYLTYGDTSEEQAKELFYRLREFDKLGAETVYVRCPKKTGVGVAVYNRLLRAAGFEVIKL